MEYDVRNGWPQLPWICQEWVTNVSTWRGNAPFSWCLLQHKSYLKQSEGGTFLYKSTPGTKLRHTSCAHKNYLCVLKAHPALADILLLTLFVKVNVTRRDTFVRTVTNFVTWWIIGINIIACDKYQNICSSCNALFECDIY